jgi:DNA ligase-1
MARCGRCHQDADSETTTEIGMSFNRRSILATLGALALPAAARTGPGVMLARDAAPGLDPAGFLVSEKFDGVRALWDGRRLRFRSGLPVAAPTWFTQGLPPMPLDGELWLARGGFEALAGAVRRLQPRDDEWQALRYLVFDLPGADGPFHQRARQLAAQVQQAGFATLQAVAQQTLPDAAALHRRLDEVIRSGGEGLVLHHAQARWRAGRSDQLLKLKPLADAEATVIGHQPGRGRLSGLMGALQVRTEDGFMLAIGTGFSDEQRRRPPPVGSIVTFTYRGRTASGVPRFASFLRVFSA